LVLCTLRAPWTLTSAVRRLRSLTGEYAGVGSLPHTTE
jgi:hypothetical protein